MKTPLLVLSFLTMTLYASAQLHHYNAISYETNRFGDIFPVWENVPEEELSKTLLDLVDAFKETRRAIILKIPHERSSILSSIFRANFSFHCGNQHESTWIVKNRASIPEPFTAIHGAHIIAIKEDKILIVEESSRRGELGFPAGTADLGEFARETAIRELYEEVGLTIATEKLKLIALINRKNVNEQGASFLDHCFLAENPAGILVLDSIEIIRAFWIPLKEVAESIEINGLKIPPYINAVVNHVLSGCSSSYSVKFLDKRQWPIVIDPSDTMDVDFFYQD